MRARSILTINTVIYAGSSRAPLKKAFKDPHKTDTTARIRQNREWEVFLKRNSTINNSTVGAKIGQEKQRSNKCHAIMQERSIGLKSLRVSSVFIGQRSKYPHCCLICCQSIEASYVEIYENIFFCLKIATK